MDSQKHEDREVSIEGYGICMMFNCRRCGKAVAVRGVENAIAVYYLCEDCYVEDLVKEWSGSQDS